MCSVRWAGLVVPGMAGTWGPRWKGPGQPYLGGRRIVGAGDRVGASVLLLGGGSLALQAGDGEERDEGDALLPAQVHQPALVGAGPVQAVGVLHADHGRDRPGLGDDTPAGRWRAEVPD